MRHHQRPVRTTRAGGRGRVVPTVLASLLLVALLAAAPSPARADAPAGADPGPLVTLPFSNQIFPYPTTGDPGPGTLNALVSQQCNNGAPLTERQWFTLPSDGSGLIAVLAQRLQWWGAAHRGDPTPVGVAVVDQGTGSVLGCGPEPVAVQDGHRRSVVAWTNASVIDGCPADDGCWLDPIEVFVNWTTGRPANDRWQDAKPITALPYRTAADSTLADSDGPLLTPDCSDTLAPEDANTVWWRFTPAVDGALPVYASAETYGPPGNQSVFSPTVTVARLTDDGPVDLPEPVDCDSPRLAEVRAGTTYLISLHDYVDDYYDNALVHGGRTTLTVGALRPTTPRNVTATGADRSVVLNWSPPRSAGSSAITEYRIRVLPDGPTFSTPADTHTFTATSLTNGEDYAFQVTAVNAAGPGNPVTTATVQPAFDDRLPTEPTDVVLAFNSGPRTETMTWSPPTSAGGSAITGYRVTRSAYDSADPGPLSALLPASARSYTFSNLRAASAYTVTLQAVNAVGSGRAFEATLFINSDTPSPPRNVSTVAGAGAVGVSWAPPADPGSSFVTSYRIRTFVGSGPTPVKTETVDYSARFLQVNGLTAGTPYTFDVTAISDTGTGEPSDRTAPITPTTTPVLPSAPTSVAAVQAATTGDQGSATLTWSPPAFDGGSAITGYRVSRNGRDTAGAGPSSTTVPAGTRSVTFAHLNLWDTYAFTVRPINAAGTGPATTRAVTITDPRPSMPTSIRAVAGNRRVTITWRPPLNSAQGITRYRIRRYAASGTTVQATSTVAGTARAFTSTGLTNGTAYRFDVTAVNASGTGRPSNRTAAVRPVTVPGAPRIGTATSGAAGGVITAKAAWSAPSSNGGTAITGYRVTALRVDAKGNVLGRTVSAVQPASTRTLSMRLPRAGTYQFTVQAVNAVGTGPASARSNRVAGR